MNNIDFKNIFVKIDQDITSAFLDAYYFEKIAHDEIEKQEYEYPEKIPQYKIMGMLLYEALGEEQDREDIIYLLKEIN